MNALHAAIQNCTAQVAEELRDRDRRSEHRGAGRPDRLAGSAADPAPSTASAVEARNRSAVAVSRRLGRLLCRDVGARVTHWWNLGTLTMQTDDASGRYGSPLGAPH
jgi:hypothetical protein